MKTFKKADLIFQVALIIVFTIITLIKPGNVYLSYFVVGSLQVLSMLIHTINGWNTRKGSKRYIYHRITLATLVIAALSSVVPYFFFVWFVLLFISPLMAMYYTWICFYEVMHAAKRPLELI